MKIYVVIWSEIDCQGRCLGVFSSEKKAEEALAIFLASGKGFSPEDYEIEELELDVWENT